MKRPGCLIASLITIVCLSGLLNLILLGVIGAKFSSAGGMLVREIPRYEEVLVEKGSGDQKIALIHLDGLISSSVPGALGQSMVQDMKLALRQAADDEKVRAIVLHIDSPGGEVTASDVIYHEVVKARAKKPVVVHMGSVAASGGYYIACGGTHLIANETTITGSIGVIIQTLNYRELLGKIGLESVTFKSGQFKDILNGARQMTPEEQAYIQALVMQTYDKFLTVVATERKLPADALRAGIADGRILSGEDAREAKLIDALGHIEDAFAKARELGGAPGAAIVQYQAPFALGKIFRLLGQSESAKVEVKLPGGMLPLESGRLYLLPSFYAP